MGFYGVVNWEFRFTAAGEFMVVLNARIFYAARIETPNFLAVKIGFRAGKRGH
jgi:hypothetical protein